MKHFLVFSLCVILAAAGFPASAQDVNGDQYRRSSVCLILMDETDMPFRNEIREAFLTAPMPDKYNDHNIPVRSFDPTRYTLGESDKSAYQNAVNLASEEVASNIEGGSQKKKGGGLFGQVVKAAASSALSSQAGTEKSVLIDNTSREEYAMLAHKHLMEEEVAKQLFDKWFIDDYGDFTFELVQQRGLYAASALDIEKAKSSVRGMGMLADAGEELINNTFVVVSRFRYLNKDELISEIEASAKAVAAEISADAVAGVELAMLATKASLGSGYYVRATSFLFQLRWNEDISNTLYMDLWDNPSAYHRSDIFDLKYIGQEIAWSNVKAGIFTNKEEDELIRIATVNANDAVLAKLEKKYDVFKTKTPLLSAEPLTAAIGMKEGLEPGDKYDVLERVVDSETGKTTYKRKATIRVSKDQLWDNRYMADEEQSVTGKVQDFNVTRFEGSSNGLYPGMLLRQTK